MSRAEPSGCVGCGRYVRRVELCSACAETQAVDRIGDAVKPVTVYRAIGRHNERIERMRWAELCSSSG